MADAGCNGRRLSNDRQALRGAELLAFHANQIHPCAESLPDANRHFVSTGDGAAVRRRDRAAENVEDRYLDGLRRLYRQAQLRGPGRRIGKRRDEA